MKKKLGIGIIAALMVASAVVFANSKTTIKSNSTCPNHPGCICNTNGKGVKSVTKANKDVCPNDPNCICPDSK